MLASEYCKRLHELSFICGINQRYHHHKQWLYGLVDKLIRVTVGVLAVFGLVLSTPGVDVPPAGFILAIVSLGAALALNVIPVGDWEKTHGELYRLWCDLRKDAEIESAKSCSLKKDKDVADCLVDRLYDMTGKQHSLDADEPAPSRKLLLQCQGDETESRYGAGIRTNEQVTELNRKTNPVAGAAGAEADELDGAKEDC